MTRLKYAFWIVYRISYFVFRKPRKLRKDDFSKFINLFKPLLRTWKHDILLSSVSINYPYWIESNNWSLKKESLLESRLAQASKPLISIVMPCYKPPLEYFAQAVSSLKNQTYQNWELCICDDASEDLNFTAVLKDLMQSDSRIKLLSRSENGNISRSTNDAVTIATGDYIVFMDQDDLLVYDALAEIVFCIDSNPGV